MSLITEIAPERDGYSHAVTVEVVTRQLRKGFAAVIDGHPNPKLAVTWAIAPNDPALGIGFHIRDHQRDHLESVPES